MFANRFSVFLNNISKFEPNSPTRLGSTFPQNSGHTVLRINVTFFAPFHPHFVTFFDLLAIIASHLEAINPPFASCQSHSAGGGYRQESAAIGKNSSIFRSFFDRFLPIDSHAFGSSPVTAHFLVSSASSFSIAHSPASAECKASWIAATSLCPPSDQ